MARATKGRRKKWAEVVEKHGIKVKLAERRSGGPIWIDVRGVPGLRGRAGDRRSLKHSDRARAHQEAEALCAALAEAQLVGVTPGGLTLGQLFAKYREKRLPNLDPGRAHEAETRMAMFEAAWGREKNVLDISQADVDAYARKRQALEVVAPGLRPDDEGKRRRGYRTPQPPRPGALYGELSWFSTCCNFAVALRVNDRRVLRENPIKGLKLPKEQNPRRPISSHDRYGRTQQRTDEVDSAGRLRCILALARYTGRRENAICQLRAADLLLTPRSVGAALAAAGMDERLAEHMPHGAIRWAAENDKQGFLFISPINREARTALDAYLRTNPRLGDVPLFPAPGPRLPKKGQKPGPEKPIGRTLAAKWLVRAETLAGLPKLVGGRFHPYRRLWASERKHLSDVDVAASGGWRDTRALKKSYQQPDPETVLRVIELSGT